MRFPFSWIKDLNCSLFLKYYSLSYSGLFEAGCSGHHYHSIYPRDCPAHFSLVAYGDAITKLRKDTSNYRVITGKFSVPCSLPAHQYTQHHSVTMSSFFPLLLDRIC